MRIAQLAPTYERVPPATYGGTELVVHLLTEELVRRGHDVTLFATGDSETSATLRALTPAPVRYGGAGTIRHPEHIHLANAQACFREAAAGAFDLVHNHAGLEGLVLAATSDTPVITTNHNAFASGTESVWDAYPWRHVSLSGASAVTFPKPGALVPVHNGIDVDSFPFAESPTDDLLFLGRLSPEKGPDRAIAAARRASRSLVLAGKIDAVDRPYFDLAVAPLLDDGQARFIGEVDANQKRELLSRSAALLFPIEWEEPFGLVVVEALACGTPVVAFDRGGVREIIEHGETGFVVDGVEAMAEAIRHIGALSRRRCRRAAEERFDVGRMVDDYEARYSETIAGGLLAADVSALVRW